MKSPDTKYTNVHEHLSEEQLIRYRQQGMEDAEMHRVELHLLECELCSDALEGMELLEPAQAEEAFQDLKGRLSARLEQQNSYSGAQYWKWGIAASILLIAATVFFWPNNSPINVEEQSSTEVAREERREEIQEVPYLSYEEEKERTPSTEQVGPPKPVQEIAEEEGSSTEVLVPELLRTREKETADRAVEVEEELAESVQTSADLETEEERTNAEIEQFIFRSNESIAAGTTDSGAIIRAAKNADTPALAQSRGIRISGTNSTDIDHNYRVNRVEIGSQIPSAEFKELKGKITDQAGEPLAGVIVQAVEDKKGTTTDINGEYRLLLPRKDATLEFSYIGFDTKKVSVPDSSTHLLAVLNEDTKSLSEVVVIGYGAQRKREVTGAVTSVSVVSPPKPADGMRALRKYFRQHQRYTAEAREAQVEGAVEVEFFVEPDSSLSNFRILKSLGYGLDEEAIRLLKEGPKWQPAHSDDNAVRHKASIKVPFKLD